MEDTVSSCLAVAAAVVVAADAKPNDMKVNRHRSADYGHVSGKAKFCPPCTMEFAQTCRCGSSQSHPVRIVQEHRWYPQGGEGRTPKTTTR